MVTTRHRVTPYLWACVLVGICIAARWAAEPILGGQAPYLPFILAVMGAAYLGGVGPGILSAVASTVFAVVLFEPDRRLSNADLAHLVVFIVETFGIILLTGALRRARDEARTAAEREAVARADAEAAGSAREQFIARVAHEWRQPLNVVAGWNAQLASKCGDPHFVGRAAGAMSRAIEIQVRLVNDLLDYSRGSYGKLSLEPRRISLREPLERALDIAVPGRGDKHVDVRLEAHDPDLAVWGDPTRLEQVFANLLTNAIKFTPEGGRVRVSLRRVGDEAEVAVTDTGIGIAPEALPRVFRPFEQADAHRDMTLGGLGLGLAITRELVALHGGSIQAASDGPDRGSTFTVRLPLASERPSARETPRPTLTASR